MIRNIALFVMILICITSQAENYPLSEVVDIVVLGARAQDTIGEQVFGAGDINGDGLSDLTCVSTNTSFPIEEEKGYLVLGATNSLSIIDLLDAPQNSVPVVRAVNRVGSVGDFNGDGYSDFGVADVLSSTGGIPASGKTLIIYGCNHFPLESDFSNPGIPSFEIYGSRSEEWLGTDIRAAGDMNGDGFDDVMLGGNKSRSQNLWEVVIIYGGTDVPSILSTGDLGEHGFIVESAFALDRLGDSMAAVGDVNGDGFDDVLLGADASEERADNAYLIYGGTDVPAVINVGSLGNRGIHIQGAIYEAVGRSVGPAGDVNQDGLADFFVGAPARDPRGRSNAGEIAIIFGATNLPSVIPIAEASKYGIKLIGSREDEFIGEKMAGGMNLNGDEYPDYLIVPNESLRIIYILYGGPELSTKGEIVLSTLNPIQINTEGRNGYQFPESIADLGDINGDGYSDIALGDEFSHAYEGTPEQRFSSGLIHIILGGPDKFGLATPTPTMTPTKVPSPTKTPTLEPSNTPTPTLPYIGQYQGWILYGDGEVKVTSKPTPEKVK